LRLVLAGVLEAVGRERLLVERIARKDRDAIARISERGIELAWQRASL
jgi:hypothetical protein